MEKIIERIENTNKQIKIRYGFGWKGAEWNNTTKENLIENLQEGHYAHYDVYEEDDFFGISFYSANDMW